MTTTTTSDTTTHYVLVMAFLVCAISCWVSGLVVAPFPTILLDLHTMATTGLFATSGSFSLVAVLT
eukprot:3663034-Amphidinium_carterae.1